MSRAVGCIVDGVVALKFSFFFLIKIRFWVNKGVELLKRGSSDILRRAAVDRRASTVECMLSSYMHFLLRFKDWLTVFSKLLLLSPHPPPVLSSKVAVRPSCDSPNTSRRFALSASNVCLVGETRRAPSRHSKKARVYGHTTAAMHKLSTPPPPENMEVQFFSAFK